MEAPDARALENGISRPQVEVAVVGGGIIGIVTALGLLRRGFGVTIYERAAKWPEIGAGFAFTGVARECMQRLDPLILEALYRVAQKMPNDYLRFWDAFYPQTKQVAEKEETSLLFEAPEDNLSFRACLRTPFLLELASYLPEGVAQFGKQLVGYDDKEDNAKVALRFADGSSAKADVVIGCDGVHSATRKMLLGPDHPASKAKFSHKTVYRALVPLSGAVSALGSTKANHQGMHLGPNAHMVSYPVSQPWFASGPLPYCSKTHELRADLAVPLRRKVNTGPGYIVSLFLHDPGEWPDAHAMEVTSTRDEVADALKHWGPHMRDIVRLLPEKLNKFAIFDLADCPLPTYAAGRVCLAGDAAHASSPFHGAGAGMGVEDALVLAEVLQRASEGPTATRHDSLKAALQTFSMTRMGRTQWLVLSSRELGDIFQWRYPATGEDSVKAKAEFEQRARKIWDFNVDSMVAQAKDSYDARMKGY